MSVCWSLISDSRRRWKGLCVLEQSELATPNLLCQRLNPAS